MHHTIAWKKKNSKHFTQKSESEIAEWLKENYIHRRHVKCKTLIRLVKSVKNYIHNKVDEVTKLKNCAMLYLPPHHCNFNLIELIRTQVKGALGVITQHLSDVKHLLIESVYRLDENA